MLGLESRVDSGRERGVEAALIIDGDCKLNTKGLDN